MTSLMKRKTSEMWMFFEPIDGNIACCNICKANISYKTSISNLRKHMKNKHPFVVLPNSRMSVAKNRDLTANPSCSTQPQPEQSKQDDMNQNQLLSQDQIVTASSVAGQQHLTTYFRSKNISNKQKCDIDIKLQLLFISDLQPFSVVEDFGFQQFVKALNPNYQLPSRYKVSDTIIPALYEECINKVKDVLKTGSSFCITTDCWTSITTSSYIGVTAHFIDTNFKFNSILLECCKTGEASHTAHNLANELKRVVESWEINDKICLAVSDNAPNIKSAIATILQWKHFPCVAHTLNLILKSGKDGILEQEAISPIVEKVRKIVSHFRKSNISTDKLNTYQINNGKVPLRLLTDVQTRWNSTYYMLKRFVELEEAIKSTIALLDANISVLTMNEWRFIKNLCTILQHFECATKTISGETYCSASLVIPLTRGLLDVYKALLNQEFPLDIKNIISSLITSIIERLGNVENSSTLLMCTFLDPRFKTMAFSDTSVSESAKKIVEKAVIQQISKQLTLKEVRTKEKVSTEDEGLSIWTSFQTNVSKATTKGTATSRAIIEIQRYLEEEIIERTDDPILWWKENQFLFPNLAVVARTKLCALASSVPCERLFSNAGQIISERRSRLTDDKAKMLIFLNGNYKYLENYNDSFPIST